MKRIFAIMLITTVAFLGTVKNVFAQEKEILSDDNQICENVNAKACVLMDCNTGTILAAKNENDKLYPASVTKIMSLLLVCEALENGKLTREMEITCSESAAEKGGSQIWLEPGEVMTVNDLIKATAVYSANDACCLLGEAIAGDEGSFVDMMNKKAKELNMNNTHFDNCTGLDDDTDTHKTTAYDIAVMSCELLKYDVIREYSSIWMDTLRNGDTQIVNTNKLIRNYPGATGLKTGTTSKAGCCVSASAERDGMHLVAVVLGAGNSKDRFSGAKNLLDWGFANYEIFEPDIGNGYSADIQVNHGVQKTLKLTNTVPEDILIKRGMSSEIDVDIQLPEFADAPIEKGKKIGEIRLTLSGEIIGICDIIADETIEEMTFFNALKSLLYAFSK